MSKVNNNSARECYNDLHFHYLNSWHQTLSSKTKRTFLCSMPLDESNEGYEVWVCFCKLFEPRGTIKALYVVYNDPPQLVHNLLLWTAQM